MFSHYGSTTWEQDCYAGSQILKTLPLLPGVTRLRAFILPP
ncbi:hypothetical protein ACPOL_0829 [Acidisarcina polymorpha]|uniref:Uncharacterized protein n=1 Tax=Acidisarcina polymorpha TaxID=2211140 RepID=A0A2Z5FTN9_9BACT|nr:hypothetical protein ACPOL_0829 [Acidisarcina polymorpha]